MIVLGTHTNPEFAQLAQARGRIQAIVIGGSAGSFSVVNNLLESLPNKFRLPIILCLHRLKDKREGFKEALQIRSGIPVEEPDDKGPILPGRAYVAPANYHLLVESDNRFSLATSELVQFSRPSIDVLFESAADVYGPALVGILLSGANRDGASGLAWIRKKGGLTVVQDPKDCAMATMPESALHLTPVDWILPAIQIGQLLQKIG
jgi:two-component system, chemotaxis family, protein-glutamate methylesterase/glutaminase